ncbi:protease inhibitor 1-like [Eublepharis macularius]|uniref:Protease inhibitor 1-like n=1 Tax=Eublepharis macularius TaxID=481883 RepID=A0AA97L014_EUBMA|nr:protease inhibitor 1-like [Eublepharis macularius]
MRRSGLLLLVGLLVFWAELAPGSGQKPPPGLPYRCTLPPETGPCKMNIKRYYYNPRQRRCMTFTWGGCQGNSNNFKTKEECERVCMRIRPANPTA